MIEKPLDRLNYYNGQRLEASDLKLEQEYHIRTRRWLNKSLYTAGIARGLDIRAEKDSRFVIVSPGLALDTDGREILLLEEEHIFVPGKVQTTGGSEAKVEGLYLTICYNEEAIQEERNGCIPKSTNGKKNGNHVPWGGPALVRAKPVFNWSDALPYDSSGEILLGEVELTPDCTKVHQINTGVRRYVGAASDAKVRQYALEGERNIDEDSPGKIYFHVRGRQPNAVTLYLRAEKFPTLYYTEMGNHAHGLAVNGTIGGPIEEPANPANTIAKPFTDTEMSSPTDATRHTHDDFQASYFGDDGRPLNCAIQLVDWPKVFPVTGVEDVFLGKVGQGNLLAKVSSGTWARDGHFHTQNSFPAVIQGATQHIHRHEHSHSFTFDSNSSRIKPAGILSDPGSPLPVSQGYSGRGSSPLTYVDGLRVRIDGVPVTDAIIAQLKAADPIWFANSKDKLGDGTSSHPFVADESRPAVPIKLDFLPGVFFKEGEHSIELVAPEIKDSNGIGIPNGGRILYNLYVE